MNNNEKAIKSGVWYTVSQFLITGFSFITTPIFSRLMSKADYGLYSNYSAIGSIASIIVSLRLQASLIRGRFDYKDSFNDFIFSISLLTSLLAVIWMGLILVFKDFFENITGITQPYLMIMATYLVFYPVFILFQDKERYEYKYKTTVFLSVVSSVFSALLSVLLVMTLKDKYQARVIGGSVPVIITGLIIYISYFKNKYHYSSDYLKYAVPVSLPSIPHALSLSILNSFDRVMITNICGSESNALYSIGYNCGAIVTILISSINSAYSPWLGENLHKKDYIAIRKLSRKMIALFAFLTIGVMLLAPEVLMVLGGEKYIEAKYVIPPIIMSCFCQFVYTLYVNVEQFTRKTIGIAFGSVIAALLNYVLNLIFIPKYGYIAAAYTTLIGYIFLMIFHIVLVHALNLGEINDTRSILIVTFIMSIITILCAQLYRNTNLRWIVTALYIFIFLFVCIKDRHKLIAVIKIITKRG